MNKFSKKAGMALAVLLVSSMVAVAPANARDNHSGAKVQYSTGGYHDGHHKRYAKQRHWRRHAKRNHGKHHRQSWKRHNRMHRDHAYYDGYRRSNRHSGYRDYDRSGYSIKFYYHDS